MKHRALRFLRIYFAESKISYKERESLMGPQSSLLDWESEATRKECYHGEKSL